MDLLHKQIWQAIKTGCQYGQDFPDVADQIILANQHTLIKRVLREVAHDATHEQQDG